VNPQDSGMADSEPTRLVLVRHGETAWNADTRLQGQTDIELNDTGRWQAARLAAPLADEGLAAVYASDLKRAHETARALAGPLALPLATDMGLRERAFGVLEGLTYQEIDQRWPEMSERWRRREPGFGPPGGETLQDFYRRCVDTAARLARAHRGQAIALVAHGGVLDCLYRAALGLPLDAPRSWQLGNASINRVLHHDGGFSLVGWNDTWHLQTPTLDEGTA
jgi:2,3-bisphosphoglycerate-dependent phosphoglycerate mutase